MKKTTIPILGLALFVLFILLILCGFFRMNGLYQTFLPFSTPILSLQTAIPGHGVERLNGLKIKWQLLNINVDYRENGSYMRINNGKIFYIGFLANEPTYRIVGLNEADGSVYLRTDPIGGGTEFTVDDSSLYVAKNISEIYKYDLSSQQRVWTRKLSNSHAPCCLGIINGELQIFWYPNRFYVLSAKDGNIIKEVGDAQNYLYRIENSIIYRRGGSSYLMAIEEDGTTLWEVGLKSYLNAPIFTKDTIYVKTGDRVGNVFALDRASGKILWKTDAIVISNLAVSNNRVYYLTMDGQLLGANGGTGEVEKSASIVPQDFYPITTKPSGYEVAYDPDSQTVIIILGNSAQMIAFSE